MESTTVPPLADLARRYRFNEGLLSMVSEGFSPDDWAFAPPVGGNCALWILGHLVLSRRFLLRKLGVELAEDAWEGHFGMGAEPGDPTGYPSPATLTEAFREVGEGLSERCAVLTAAEVAAPWGSTFPDGSDTLGGVAGFLYMHETYHLGQLGLLRRMCGRPGFA